MAVPRKPTPWWVLAGGVALAGGWIAYSGWVASFHAADVYSGAQWFFYLGPEPWMAVILAITVTRRRWVSGAATLAAGLGVVVSAQYLQVRAWSTPEEGGYNTDAVIDDEPQSPTAIGAGSGGESAFSDESSEHVIIAYTVDWADAVVLVVAGVLVAAAAAVFVRAEQRSTSLLCGATIALAFLVSAVAVFADGAVAGGLATLLALVWLLATLAALRPKSRPA